MYAIVVADVYTAAVLRVPTIIRIVILYEYSHIEFDDGQNEVFTSWRARVEHHRRRRRGRRRCC